MASKKATSKPEVQKPAAVLTINHPEIMNKRTRAAIAKWIRKQADFFEENHGELAKRYTARYHYRD